MFIEIVGRSDDDIFADVICLTITDKKEGFYFKFTPVTFDIAFGREVEF